MSKHLTNLIVSNFKEGKSLRANDWYYAAYCHEWHLPSQTCTSFKLLSSIPVLFLGARSGGFCVFRLVWKSKKVLVVMTIHFQFPNIPPPSVLFTGYLFYSFSTLHFGTIRKGNFSIFRTVYPTYTLQLPVITLFDLVCQIFHNPIIFAAYIYIYRFLNLYYLQQVTSLP